MAIIKCVIVAIYAFLFGSWVLSFYKRLKKADFDVDTYEDRDAIIVIDVIMSIFTLVVFMIVSTFAAKFVFF